MKWIIELNKMIAYCRYRALLTNDKFVKDEWFQRKKDLQKAIDTITEINKDKEIILNVNH